MNQGELVKIIDYKALIHSGIDAETIYKIPYTIIIKEYNEIQSSVKDIFDYRGYVFPKTAVKSAIGERFKFIHPEGWSKYSINKGTIIEVLKEPHLNFKEGWFQFNVLKDGKKVGRHFGAKVDEDVNVNIVPVFLTWKEVLNENR